jgi:thiamine biosynthesis lipoprotein
VRDALVNLSGNMVAMGDAAGKSGWTVGIRDPAGARDYLARLRLYDQAVATSGDYESSSTPTAHATDTSSIPAPAGPRAGCRR